MATVLLLVIVNVIWATHTEGDDMNYIQMDSSITPKTNTSYGNIQILNEITIEFNLIYHENNHSDDPLNSIQNIFHLKSTQSIDSNSAYCTHYPSMWFTPIDNSLYFSLLNDIYCLETYNEIIADVTYAIKIHYDESSLYIAINNKTLIHEAHHLEFHELNQIADTVKLWISDTFSDPARVTLYDLHIFTPISDSTSSDINPPKTVVNYVQTTKYRNTHPNTIFIIEIAVLSIFAFACLGVIIASLCLLKMRRSKASLRKSKKRAHAHVSNLKHEIAAAASDLQQSYKKVKLSKIVSNSPNSNSVTIEVYDTLRQHSIANSGTTAITESKIDKDISTDGLSTDYSTFSKAYLSANPLSLTFNSSKKKLTASESKDKYKHISATIAESPQLPESPKSLSMDPAAISDIYGVHSYDGDFTQNGDALNSKSIDAASEDGDDERCDIDAYDLNSEEGDDIKLRRAAIQSQRAVVEAFNIIVEPFEAPSDAADDDEDEPMDGVPVIQSIYDTIHHKPLNMMSPSGSSEDLFHSTDIITHDASNDRLELGATSGPNSSIAGVAGSGNGSIGPSLPSLAATELTSNPSNRYSTVTNATFLTDCTKRLLMPMNEEEALSEEEDDSNDSNDSNDSSDSSSSNSSDSLSSISSVDESTCITIPRTQRQSTTVSTLSMALPRSISDNYGNTTQSDSSTGNIQLSKSKSSDSPLFGYAFKGNKVESNDDTSTILTLESSAVEIHEPMQEHHQISSSAIVGRIKMMREKYSMGYHTSEENDLSTLDANHFEDLVSKTMSHTISNTSSFVRYETNHHQFVSSDDTKKSVIDTVVINNTSKCDTNVQSLDISTETSEEEKNFEWIRDTLQSCDENGWESYYNNFKTHKVNESRLIRLDDIDWRELIPAIGPRNDFKNLWRIRRQRRPSNDINQAVV